MTQFNYTLITSLQHPIVKHLFKLRNDRNYRTQMQTALISGLKLIYELCPSFLFHTVFIEEGYTPILPITSQKTFRVPHALLKKITGLQNPEPLAAEIQIPTPLPSSLIHPLLILDRIADPGNLGTILRSALALGWKEIFITPHSTDPFNDKALRAAKGATFKLQLHEGSYEELLARLQIEKRYLLIADSKGAPITPTFSSSSDLPLALVIGNESHGSHPDLKKYGRALAIPMHHEMESLNVATAAAILMFYLQKKD